MRHIRMSLLLVTSLALPLAAQPQTPAPAPRPNVVIFVADDMGWNDVGYHGSEIRTPHIDRLVARGVELDRFYAFPFCSPTRAALLTGRSPLRFGITRPVGRVGGLPLEEHILPQSFGSAGYQTALVGKWHLGAPDGAHLPHRRGFDHFYGFIGGVLDYYTHESQRGGLDWQRNGEDVIEEGYSTDLIAREAVRWLRDRDRKRPVFLEVCFNAPHTPLQAPESVIRKYESIENRGRRVHAAMVDAMDTAIGRVLEVIDDEGMRDSTLVLFFSDNGGARGRAGGASNEPLRGAKGGVFEGGIRVPAVMRWPGVLGAGRRSRQVITVLDLLPTLTAAAGIPAGNPRPLDGQDLWPAIRDGKAVARNDVVMGNRQTAMVLHGPWKLIRFARPGGGVAGSALYRIAEDPGEERDLASEHRAVVEELTSRITRMTDLLPEAGFFGGFGGPGGRRRPGPGRLVAALDADGDGTISAEEIAAAPAVLKKLDQNGDGSVSREELRPAGPPGGRRPGGPGGRPARPRRPAGD